MANTHLSLPIRVSEKTLLISALLFLVCDLYSQNNLLPAWIPTDGLYGYWPLDGNINDLSGNNKNATLPKTGPSNDCPLFLCALLEDLTLDPLAPAQSKCGHHFRDGIEQCQFSPEFQENSERLRFHIRVKL